MELHPKRWPYYAAGSAGLFMGVLGVANVVAGHVAAGVTLMVGGSALYEAAYRLVRNRVARRSGATRDPLRPGVALADPPR